MKLDYIDIVLLFFFLNPDSILMNIEIIRERERERLYIYIYYISLHENILDLFACMVCCCYCIKYNL